MVSIKPISLYIVVGCCLLGHNLFADSIDSNALEDVTTAEEANQLAIKYELMAKHYRELEAKLNNNQDASSNKPSKVKKTSSDKKEKAKIKKQPKSPFNGTNATLGFQYNTGNTFQRNISSSTNINYRQSKNILHTLAMNYQNAYDYHKDDATANKFFASGQSEYDFSPYNGVYANVQYLNDHLSGYVFQINENIGYKRRLYKNHGMTFDTFLGPGMQQTRQTQDTGGDFHNEPSIQVKTQYKWKLNDKTSYNQLLQWIKTPRHYTVGLTMALTTSLYNSFGLQPSFTLSYDSNPPIKSDDNQLKKLDTTTQISFVYNF